MIRIYWPRDENSNPSDEVPSSYKSRTVTHLILCNMQVHSSNPPKPDDGRACQHASVNVSATATDCHRQHRKGPGPEPKATGCNPAGGGAMALVGACSTYLH